jgi:hypothetical protein
MALVKLNNNGVKDATAFGSITGLGNLILIKTQTASGSASISFVDGASDVVLDSTYKEYIFYFNNIHPATGAAKFRIIGSTDTGSSYGVATTTTMFEALHNEAGADGTVRYEDGDDAAQSTSAINISTGVGSDADECLSGYISLFEPSSTTFVKHFISKTQFVNNSGTPYSKNNFSAGYINTTSAVDAIQFSFSSGNIDDGTISLYGVV